MIPFIVPSLSHILGPEGEAWTLRSDGMIIGRRRNNTWAEIARENVPITAFHEPAPPVESVIVPPVEYMEEPALLSFWEPEKYDADYFIYGEYEKMYGIKVTFDTDYDWRVRALSQCRRRKGKRAMRSLAKAIKC